MSDQTIYVDIDDVLCETAQHCLRVVEREFGRKVEFDKLFIFDLGIACGLSSAESDHLYEVIHRPLEILEVDPIPDAIETLRRWEARDYDIALVTGRPPSTMEPTLAWLDRHGIPRSSLTFVDKYGRFEIAGTTAIRLEDLTTRRYAWAVEDSLPMAHFLASRMHLPVMLLDRPWNKTETAHANIVRYNDWEEIGRHPGQWRSLR